MKEDKLIKENIVLSIVFLVLLLIAVKTSLGLYIVLIFICPLIIISYRNDFKMSIMVILINIIIALLVLGITGMAFAIFAGTTGFVMGSFYKKEKIWPAIIGGTIVVIINIVIVLGLSNLVNEVSIAEVINESLMLSIDSLEDIMTVQLEEEQQEVLVKQYKELVETFIMLIPFMLIALSVLIVLINHFTASNLLRKFDNNIPRTKPFREWMFPRSIIIYYFLTVLVVVINPDLYIFKVAFFNLLPILTIILLIQGLSFIFYYSYVKRISKALPIIAIIFVFIPIINQIIQIIGMIDLSFDYRSKLIK